MDPKRYRVIDIEDRAERVYNFQKNTRFALKELLEAAGLNHPSALNRRHIVRRLSASQIKLADQIYPINECNSVEDWRPNVRIQITSIVGALGSVAILVPDYSFS